MFDRFWGRGTTFATREAVIYLFRSFTFLGMNPPKSNRPLYFLYAACINFLIIILSPLLFNLTYFLENHKMTTSQFLTSLQAAMNDWGIPPKIITMTISLKILRSSERLMTTLDERCTSDEELAKIREVVMRGNRYMIGFGVVYAIYGTSTFLTSMAIGQPPFSFYIPFMDWRNSRSEFIMQEAFELIMLFYLLYYQVANDCYAVIYICIIRAHMQILVNRVRCLGKQPDKSGEDNFNELVMCIKDHQCLLNLLETISPIISITIFVQFLITAAILCTTMMNIFLFANTTERIGSIFYFLAVTVQTFPCCYEASSLMEDSEQLPLAIFQCNWINEDKRFRKMLVFFMQRAQQTMTLTAMKLFPINLNTNLSIAKFSFSLYTLIKEMDFGRNFAKE